MRKTLSIIMVIMIISSLLNFSASAESNINFTTVSNYEGDGITIIFHNEVTEETKNKIITHFSNNSSNQLIESRGLTCTLLGHDLETGSTTTVTHNARTTVPRCLRETYSYEICSRCDYSEYTLTASQYIYCCS